MNHPIVFVIVLNWNGKEDTLACINSLYHTNYSSFNIIVVDNGSTDDSVITIRLAYPDLIILENNKNLGYAEGNNVGIRYALSQHADYILVLNNDTSLDPECLIHLVRTAGQNKEEAIYGPAILYDQPSNQIWFAGAEWNSIQQKFDFPLQNKVINQLPTDPFETAYICGAALFFHRSIAEIVGLFDPRFFLVCEESDWCYRAKSKGIRSIVVPQAKIWHKIGVSFGTESSPIREYYSFRNRLLWSEKNLSKNEHLILFKKSLRPFCPPLSITNNADTNFFKHLYWTFSSWFKTWDSIILRVKRRAFLDYVFRQFGHCPKYILKLQHDWQANSNNCSKNNF